MSQPAHDSGSTRRTAIRVPGRAVKPPKPRRPRKRDYWLPRQGDLTRTIRVLEHLAAGRDLPEIARTLGIETNIVGYHRNNAVILRLLDDRDRITPEGRALLRLPAELRLGRLYFAFEASEVGRLWLAWAGRRTLDALSATTAEDFLRHLCDEIYNTTWQAHEQALRIWCEELQSAHRQLNLPSSARQPALDLLPEHVVFDRGGSRDVVRALAATSSRVSVATGYFNINGYRQLADNFHYADLRLLIGSDDASRDQIKELLRRFREDINRTTRMSTADKREAVREFHLTTIRGNIRIRSLEAREKGSLHAKVYIFDREAAFVTSANLTGGAFFKNIEAGAVLRDRDKVDYLQNCFDDLFDEADPIEEMILREIERSSLLLDLQDPQLVFLKILIELFGSVADLNAEQRMHLAEYQKAIVSAVLTRLDEQRGLLLIAPTGIGKTVMTAYAAKVLMERGQVARVILVCKNEGMRENWTRTLRKFQIVAETIRVYALERSTSEVDQLFEDLRPNDLVIVDECHHFRNRFTARTTTLRRFLIGPGALQARPYALLLTATPTSTGVPNINSQLELISDESIKAVEDLASSQYALSFPLGSILQWFGDEGENKHRALQHGDGYLYFPTLKTSVRHYKSALVPVFEALLRQRNVLSEVVIDQQEIHRWTDSSGDDEDPSGLTSGFLIILLARLAESSPAALTTCIDGLLARAAKGDLPGQNPEAIADALQQLRTLVPRSDDADTKLAALFHLIDRTDDREKLIVFSEFVATVEYLKRQIAARYPTRRVAGLTGKMMSKERRELLHRFAPVAQRAPRPEAAKELDILVASDAISEGENLQDASIVINYDLPWTPLRLIQRVGRIDRFTESHRTIQAFNLFPEQREYEDVVKLWTRLLGRDAAATVISGYPTVTEHERNPSALAAASTAEWMLEVTDPNLDLTDLRARVFNFPHARLLEVLWGASDEERQAATDLPDGVQATTHGPYPGLYILIRLGDTRVALFRPEDSDTIEEAPAGHSHEYFLHRIAHGDRLKPARSQSNLDADIDALLALHFRDGPPDECQIVAALKILRSKDTPRPTAAPKPKRPEQLRLDDLLS